MRTASKLVKGSIDVPFRVVLVLCPVLPAVQYFRFQNCNRTTNNSFITKTPSILPDTTPENDSLFARIMEESLVENDTNESTKPLESNLVVHEPHDDDDNEAEADAADISNPPVFERDDFKRCCCNRWCVGITGLVIAWSFLMPNMMMSDAGTESAGRAATWGMIACLMFFVGGIVGFIFNTWAALIPGVVCQIIAFAVWN